MVREFHNKFLHVVIDCKIGNKELDLAVEGCIAGYVHLVIHALETMQMGELIDKTQNIAQEFYKKRDGN